MPEPGNRTRPATETLASEASVTFEANGCVMGYWKDVFIVVWATQATVEHVAEFAKLAALMVSQNERVSTVQVLAPGSTVPTPDARAAINGLIEQYADQLICCAAPLEGSGFWASTMRSFLTGLQLSLIHI